MFGTPYFNSPGSIAISSVIARNVGRHKPVGSRSSDGDSTSAGVASQRRDPSRVGHRIVQTVYLSRSSTRGPTRTASTRDPSGNGSDPGGTTISALAPTREANREDACGPVVEADR